MSHVWRIGVVVESVEMTTDAFEWLLSAVPKTAYELSLDASGALVWGAQQPDGPVYYSRDPHVSTLRRFGVWLLGLFPVESQL